ncbi:MAG: hypothetical protein KIS66_10765 [Fimbriimonadaceae bacterium]|nr:hypothetical protein [Fimbriimonadaceae bacterium]
MKKHLLTAMLAGVLVLPAFALAPTSGLKVGETVTPFHPTHVSGPLKGTDSCPPCTYGQLPQVQVWVNGDDHANVAAVATALEGAVKANKSKKLQAFVIVLTDAANKAKTAKMISDWSASAGATNIHMAYLLKTDEAVGAYKVNTSADVKNTIMVYKNREITNTFVNLHADKTGLGQLNAAIAKITA